MKMKSSAWYSAAFSVLMLVVLFQNCAPTRFSFLPDYKLLIETYLGQGYGGMRKGDYYRFVP